MLKRKRIKEFLRGYDERRRPIAACPLMIFKRVRARALITWLRSRARPHLCSKRSVLVFAAHPDDETLGCGGLIALKRDVGASVNIAFVTDGSGGRSDSSSEDANIRRREALRALALLQVPHGHVHFLNFPDSGLSKLDDSQRRDAVSRILCLIKEIAPDEVFLPHSNDPHPDHKATNELVISALRMCDSDSIHVFEYVVWLLWQSVRLGRILPKKGRLYALPISGAVQRKCAAVRQYRTQLPLLGEAFLRHSLEPREFFFTRPLRSSSQNPTDRDESTRESELAYEDMSS